MTPAGFPHSDIPGSKPACGSPRLIAAYHVLRRLLVPRHPPCALSSLTGLSKVLSLYVYPASRIRLSKSDARRECESHSPPPRDGEAANAKAIKADPTCDHALSRIWWRWRGSDPQP